MDEFFDFDRAALVKDIVSSEYSYRNEFPSNEFSTTSGLEIDTENVEAADSGHPLPVSNASYGPENFQDDMIHKTNHSRDGIRPDPGQSIKAGTKFSRASVRLLKNWLLSHHRYPYPTEEEKEDLKQRTGLNSSQIMNWLANARRKARARSSKSISLVEYNNHEPINIPRRATPAIEEMNPLDRWKNSPPETEPASAAAIAQAIESSHLRPSSENTSDIAYASDSSWRARSVNNESSAGSWEFSNSSRSSSASALSHSSAVSQRSIGSPSSRKARRRCRQPKRLSSTIKPASPPRTFQCTFCTESFRAKYDWQRHEKSLHLSLERWVCSLNGAISLCEETKLMSCVYCGLANPGPDHTETHNHLACSERPIQEKTFYRKDHLRQHLSLMHDTKFQIWSMSSWKVEMLNVRSRCGFCGIAMDSWKVRADHLAHHFKSGQTMAEWQGNWGFEPHILDLVENGIPPYLIHNERISLFPYKASNLTPKVQRTLYDLVKMGLVDFINDQIARGQSTADNDLLQEAHRICTTIDGVANGVRRIGVSWFRDLLLHYAQASIVIQADNLDSSQFESDSSIVSCPKERMLKEFVESNGADGAQPTNIELQTEACDILAELEAISSFPSTAALKWFCFLVQSSTNWLQEFRRRNNLAPLAELPLQISSFTASQHLRALVSGKGPEDAVGTSPHTMDPRMNSLWDPAATLNWDLSHFSSPTIISGSVVPNKPQISMPFARKALPLYPKFRPTTTSEAVATTSALPNPPPWYLFSDSNSFQRLKHELSRFVASCLSPNNPHNTFQQMMKYEIRRVGSFLMMTIHGIRRLRITPGGFWLLSGMSDWWVEELRRLSDPVGFTCSTWEIQTWSSFFRCFNR